MSSPEITHKSDSGGVRLNLSNAQAVRSAYHDIMGEVIKNRPNAHIDGIAVEPMIIAPNGRELMIGVTCDPVFGPGCMDPMVNRRRSRIKLTLDQATAR